MILNKAGVWGENELTEENSEHKGKDETRTVHLPSNDGDQIEEAVHSLDLYKNGGPQQQRTLSNPCSSRSDGNVTRLLRPILSEKAANK